MIRVVDAKKAFSRVNSRMLEASTNDSEESVVVETPWQKKVLEKFLKLLGSVKFEFVPANDWYLDKKGFKWEVGRYNEDGLGFKVTFEHPKFISVGGTDTMKVQFFNSEKYLMPTSDGMNSIPDGYTMVIELPPQGDKEQIMSPE